MSTKSNTLVYDADGLLVNLYRHDDGYPSGHGRELAEFLRSKRLVRGLSFADGADNEGKANGMGDLAAQMVAHFKRGGDAGGIYLASGVDAARPNEYTYRVTGDSMAPGKGLVIAVEKWGKPRFKGKPAGFSAFCEADGGGEGLATAKDPEGGPPVRAVWMGERAEGTTVELDRECGCAEWVHGGPHWLYLDGVCRESNLSLPRTTPELTRAYIQGEIARLGEKQANLRRLGLVRIWQERVKEIT